MSGYQHIVGGDDGQIKDESYFLAKMKGFYQLYTKNQTSIGLNGTILNRACEVRSFSDLRAHGRSVQNPDKYKTKVDPTKKKKKSVNEISWQPVPVLSKFRSIVIDKILSTTADPEVVAVDSEASLQKAVMRNFMKLLRDPSTNTMMNGVKIDEPDELAGIESKEDVDTLFQMGGIKLALEVLLKDAIDVTMAQSGKETLLKMLAEDLVDLSCIATDNVMTNGRQVLMYVDPAKLIISPSIYPDYRDSEYRGYLSYWSVANIGAILKDPDKLKRVVSYAKKSNVTYRVPEYDQVGDREKFIRSTHGNTLGVEVLKMYFIDTETERYVIGKRKNNVRKFEKVSTSFILSERGKQAGKSVEDRQILYLYEVYWVVGTDIVFSATQGSFIVEGIARDINNKIIWPLVAFNSNEPSLIERCIAFDDDLQLANYKLRRMISKMAPGPRMLIYQNMIEDSVSIAGEKYTLFDMIKTYQDEGLFILNESKTMAISPVEETSGRKPIDFLPSGIAEDYSLLRLRLLDQIDLIRQATGVNEVSDGTTNRGDMLQSVMAGLKEATNSALGPFVALYTESLKSIYEYIGYKYQVLVLKGDIDAGYLHFGALVKKIVVTQKIRLHSFLISVSLYTREMKQMLREYLITRQAELSPDAFFMVLQAIELGDLKKAQFLIAKYSTAKAEVEHQRKIEIAKATAQGNADAALAAEQAKAATIKAQLESEITRLREEYRLKKELVTLESDLTTKADEEKSEDALSASLAAIEANNRNRLNQ